jgi:hypothetical protein
LFAVVDDVDADLELASDDVANGVMDRPCKLLVSSRGALTSFHQGDQFWWSRQAADVCRQDTVLTTLQQKPLLTRCGRLGLALLADALSLSRTLALH